MGVHDAEQEEQLTEAAMAEGMDASVFDEKYQADKEKNEADDLLAMFQDLDAVEPAQENALPIAPSHSIYTDDYQFVKACFEFLNRNQSTPVADVSYNDKNQTISVVAPEDLRERFRYLPSEIWPEKGNFLLTADVAAYQKECARSRNDEHAWPKQHYLWPKHPVIEWLQERMLSNTGRHQALVLGLNAGIEADESIFLASALIPNRKASPVIWSWYAVYCRKGKVTKIADLNDTLKALGFGEGPKPNTGRAVDIKALETLRQPVVDAVKAAVLKERETLDAELQPKLNAQREELARLRGKQIEQLELTLSSSKQDTKFKESRRNTRMKHIDEVFENYQSWVEDTLQTEPAPYIQLLAVIAKVEE